MKRLLLSGLLIFSLTTWAQAQKTFTGDLLIRSLSDMETFIEEGYTKVDGNLIMDQGSPGLSNTEGVLQVYPDGLKTLKEVTGNLTLKRGFFSAPAITLARLRTVGGNLVIDDLSDMSFPQLRTVGGYFERIVVLGGALRVPRLETVNGDFEIRGVPGVMNMNRLRQVSGDLKITRFNGNEMPESISFPQLNRIDGSLTVGGSTDNSGPFKKLEMPRLKSVGQDIYVKLSWDSFEKQSWSSLEEARNITIEGGGYLAAPKLHEVPGDFVHTVRTLLTGQTMELNYPSLTAVRGKFEYDAPGINDERITLDKVLMPALNFADQLELRPGYEITEIDLSKLREANSIRLRTESLDLSLLETAENLSVATIDNFSLNLPELTRIVTLEISLEGEAINTINAPKLETAGSISMKARNLIYPALTTLFQSQSLKFDTDVTQADFRNIEHLDGLYFVSGSYEDINLTGLKTAPIISISGTQKIVGTFGSVSEANFTIRNLSSTATFDWNFSQLIANTVNVIDSENTNLKIPVTVAQKVDIRNSALGSNVFSELTSVGSFSCSSSFEGSLQMSTLKSANTIQASFSTPTAVDLSGLVSLGSFAEDNDRLSFSNVTEFNMSSILQLANLQLTSGGQTNSALKSVTLTNLQKIGELSIYSDQLEEVSLGKLTIAGQITIKSTGLKTLSLPGLDKIKNLDIDAPTLTNLGINSLKQVQDLSISNTQLTSLDLSGLTDANLLTITSHDLLTSINLSSLPALGTLTLTNLPELAEVVTPNPGVENSIKGTLTVSNLKEETVEVICTDGSLERTIFPAVRKLTLICNEGSPVIDEDFYFIGDQGTGYTFDGDISFGSLNVSASGLDFGNLDEGTAKKELTITLTNTGDEDISGTLFLKNNDAGAYSLNHQAFDLGQAEQLVVTVEFAPEVVGDYSTILEISAENSLEIPITGNKEGCIEIAGVCITAQRIIREENGVFSLSGNVVMNDFLHFGGEVTVNTNENSIAGDGAVTVNVPAGNGPFSGELTLYSGEFEYSLSDEAKKLFASKLEEGTNEFFRLANLPVSIEDLQFIEGGIQFSANMTLPPQLKSTEVKLDTVSFTVNDGFNLVGEITVPDPIRLGGVSEIRDLAFTFNTIQNEFSGSATLGTKLFDIGGTVVMRAGGLDEVKVVIIPAKPVPVGPTGWSITEGSGSIENLQTPPITLGMSVDLQPTVTAGFNLVTLDKLELKYRFGQYLRGSGALQVFDRDLLEASLEVRRRALLLEGEVNFGDFLVGNGELAVDNTAAGLKLRGRVMAKLQIPEGDSFFYQAFDGTLGLPYTVASVEAFINGTKMAGETTLLGYGMAFGVAYTDDDFVFELAENMALLNQEVFGNVGGGVANPNNFGSRFEGQSVKYKPNKSATSGGTSTSQTEQTFSISRELESIFIRVQHETVKPEYMIVMPDGTTVNPENAESFGALYIESETATKQTFYAFKNPQMGEWRISISSEDVEYNIDVAGADPEPSISFGSLQREGDELIIPWNNSNVDDRYEINLRYDTNNEGADGLEVVSELAHTATEHRWNTANISTGTYYVYAELENMETGSIKVFYAADPVQIIEAGAPDAPTSVTASHDDNEISVSWEAVGNAAEYSLYYAEGQAPSPDSEGFQTSDLSMVLNQLDPGKTYYFAVSAWNTEGVEGPRSDAVSLSFISNTLNNSPQISAINDTTIIAAINYDYTIQASDPEDDPLSFQLVTGPEGMSLNGTAITWTPTTNQLGPHHVSIGVLDGEGNSDEISYIITVTQPNDPPTDINLSSSSVTENTSDVTVGNLSATDPDANDKHSFELVSGEGDADNDQFRIEGSQLKVISAFDFETQATANIRIKTTDQVGQTFEKTFTISITNVNEAPTALSLSTTSVAENQAAGTIVATLSTTDPDAGDSHSYSLVSGDGDMDNAAFGIQGDQLQTNAILDFETQSTYQIRLSSTDAGGLKIEQAFTIEVTDGPDPEISVSPDALSFEATALGLVTSLDLTISNTGDGPLEIASMATPDGFSVAQQSFTIAPGADQTVAVSFSPTEERLYQGQLSIESNAGQVMVDLTGEGAIITSIDSPILRKEQVSVYPNPARDEFTIELPPQAAQGFELAVFDRAGSAKTAPAMVTTNTIRISVRNWSPGLYLLKVSTRQGTIVKPLIVKR